MALRKRSYRKGEYISTFFHNSKVKAHKEQLKREAEDKKRDRERNRQARLRAERIRTESKRRQKEQTLQNRMLAQQKQKHDAIAARLRDVGIDERWAKAASDIMDEYGYGLGQIRTKVMPLLVPRIEQLLLQEEREKAAQEALRKQRQLEQEKERAVQEAAKEQQRIEEAKINAASDELTAASSRLLEAAALQIEGLTQELDILGKKASLGHVYRYLSVCSKKK